MPHAQVIGIDFGTTNTVLALPTAAGGAEAVTFAHSDGAVSAFRSALAVWQEIADGERTTHTEAGPFAVDRFIAEPRDTRFLQSFKTLAASRAFRHTTIAGRQFQFEDILAAFFARLVAHGGDRLAQLPSRVVLGRPVAFAGARPDAALAAARYEAAFTQFGFTTFHHVYEPVAAAFYFAQRLTRDATVLVADFGGGTSDFSLMHFARTPRGLSARPLAHAGLAVAGDTFDYRIIDTIVSPRLGKGTRYKSWGKVLDIPGHYYASFARWSQLSILKDAKLLAELRTLARDSLAPDKVAALIAFIEADIGYPLYRAVSEAKIALTSADKARLRFASGDIAIDETIARADFERWIARDLERIDMAVTDVLGRAGIGEREVDRVFLTGGSSYVPAVRRQFDRRFGAARVETGDQLLSIAYGLAIIGQQEDVTSWTVASEVEASADDSEA